MEPTCLYSHTPPTSHYCPSLNTTTTCMSLPLGHYGYSDPPVTLPHTQHCSVFRVRHVITPTLSQSVRTTVTHGLAPVITRCLQTDTAIEMRQLAANCCGGSRQEQLSGPVCGGFQISRLAGGVKNKSLNKLENFERL